ncbi:MAG TPA: bifunctional (p)ppGpp synthetase/guanosine-3',5'-bis(diphosphate) 3'-pyrophosphohydrolase [Candidatus Aminicenantes bacterium]|nr:bifunctional (p)ppGpp synthetase/guanosine-3',5'-bis(diphosphate) 3'-pyrophosphohydrolase [Candidatus Aminicenantes bacterium]HOS10402.1 bifunctional (p)ppGpp synthetase/guanosine-3',5'-bis(diphosphate) 3'-pyrophosphohydrolase [Candidatus Aminicenantes bacterium]HPL13142.1 bifunctional (p)ppGpp synthetase/guanosine-3',5'-bis(diphosphate) 3'-pyrophosphohydrolase [Candidatus Aminicenantes bacterium]
MIRIDDILEKVSTRFSEKEIALLQKATVFSARAHKGQVRRSGEPYLSHPLEVTAQLADMNLDATALTAGLLHDVLEDTDVTAEELRETFGKDIASLVEGVTKISRVQESSPELQRAETIRKIILAMTDDMRVIFIKLADRLHNLRTLKFLPEAAQKRIAAETMEIYAPIADRLGMGRIKAELEDLAFRYVEPEEYFRMAALLEPRRKKSERTLAEFQRTLKRKIAESRIPAEIQSRIKRPYSVWQKMKTRKIDFGQVYDYLALRIITDSVRNCYQILGLIHQSWPPIPSRFRDFIAMPKPNLYQALHTTILTEDQSSFEIQIRTAEMHALAENGIAAHWRYKDKDAQALVKEDRRLHWLREMVELFKEQRDPKEFLKQLKINLIPEEVYVFTPRGRVIPLPAGASALDFAFRIHTEIGLHAAGAKINGKSSPLRTPLRTGDIVEILTAPDREPSRNWLSMAFTSGARHLIKRRLNQRDFQRAVALGRRLWERETARYRLPAGFPEGDDLLAGLKEAVSVPLRSLEYFYALLGRGKIVLNRKIMDRIWPGLQPRRKRPAGGREEIQVQDRTREFVRLAKCCSPIQGEQIIGYLTTGKGITVHAGRCHRIVNELLSPDRLIEVSWGDLKPVVYKAGLVVSAVDRPGVLARVTAVVAGQEADIVKAEVATYADRNAQIRMTLKVRNIGHLEAIRTEIARVDGVVSVDRA